MWFLCWNCSRTRLFCNCHAPHFFAQPSAPHGVLLNFAEGTRFAVWRCLLTAEHHHHEVASHSQQLGQLQRLRQNPGLWVVIMLRGGHFAGAVFRMRDTSGSRTGHNLEPYEVLAHKTFHRYVVR